MTTKEFSDAFDTLIASYNHKADFGDQASYADVTLDEYEKSVFLTQAQDKIVKTYFSRQANSTGEGFDDSIRRQADFSSLITVWTSDPVGGSNTNWNKGTAYISGTTNTLRGTGTTYNGYKLIVRFGQDKNLVVTNIINGTLCIDMYVKYDTAPNTFFTNNISGVTFGEVSGQGGITFQNSESSNDNYLGIFSTSTVITEQMARNGLDGFTVTSYKSGDKAAYDERGQLFTLPSNVLLMLNERVHSTNNKFYVVVPISYKEYDRQMSRAYSQPLKKQCWRLFEGIDSYSTISEIIPKEGVTVDYYKIRYLRRPTPIILTDLNFVDSQESLEIDGHTQISECELNPVLHMDILEEAVRMALNSKGIETRDQRAAREAARNNRS